LKLAECLQLRDVVFNVDSRIRYFGYMDNRQGMVISELRNKEVSHPGETQLLKDLTFFRGFMASWSLYFGRVRYSVVSHDMFKIVMVPVEGGLAIVTTESSFPIQLVEDLTEVIDRQFAPGKL
jgi:hypothetical protein